MSTKTHIISIYNPLTEATEDVPVSQALYDACRRGAWAIGYSDRRFSLHETMFTDLLGEHENFHEFRDELADPLEQLCRQELLAELWKIIGGLSKRERLVFRWLVIERRSGEAVAKYLGISRQRVSQIKKRALEKIKNSAQGLDNS